MILALEGLPGSGKTTAARRLAERLDAQLLAEATADHPFLDAVYNDETRRDLEVELAFLLLHVAGYRRLDAARLSISDFSPVKDLLFAEEMLSGDDLAAFEAVYARLYEGCSGPDVVVYLDLSPADCLTRVQERGRDFEQGLTVDRLEAIQQRYFGRLDELGTEVIRIPIDLGVAPDEVARRIEEAAALDDLSSASEASSA